MNSQNNFLFFFYSILFVVFFPSAGLTKNFIFEEKILTKNDEGRGKYHASAKVVPEQPLFRLEKFSPLTWPNDAKSYSSNWTSKDGSYNWRSGDQEACRRKMRSQLGEIYHGISMKHDIVAPQAQFQSVPG